MFSERVLKQWGRFKIIIDDAKGDYWLSLDSLYPGGPCNGRYAMRIKITQTIFDDFVLLSDENAAKVAVALLAKSKLAHLNGYEERPLAVDLERKDAPA